MFALPHMFHYAIDVLTITVRQAAVEAQRTMTFQYGRPLERHSYRQVLKSV